MNDENEITAELSDESTPSQKQPSLLRNYISFVGLAIVAASLTSFVLLVLIEYSSETQNPYTDLITYILVPSVLVFGLLVMLVGALLERRRRLRTPGIAIAPYPILDLNNTLGRRKFLLFLTLSFAFLFLSAFGSYRAFEYTESVAFCGMACHSVMKPEYVAYNASPHASVRCVECHVGGGAQAYVRSKFTGMRQLYGVVTGHYNRPIETPVLNMRSATETCQKCHWSEKYHGEKLKIFNHYAYDEQNTLNRTRMLIKVGGGNPNAGLVGGIHWHMNVANEVTFIASDEKRQVIPWVQMKNADGRVVEYTARNAHLTASQISDTPKRTMDCIDCHSRPAHIYLSPNDSVDRSLDAGKLPVELPFIKAKAVEALAKPYSNTDEAVAAISASITDYYKSSYPQLYASKPEMISVAVAEVQRVYQTYFFPEMKTDWSSHANNIGHYNAQGCFRCHDGQHVSRDGQVIRNECNVCHITIEQTFRGQPVAIKDGKFQHPIDLGDRNTWQCAACHKADRPFKHPLNLGDISRFQCADCHSGSYEKVKF